MKDFLMLYDFKDLLIMKKDKWGKSSHEYTINNIHQVIIIKNENSILYLYFETVDPNNHYCYNVLNKQLEKE